DALEGYVDTDYADNIDTRKSLSGFVFTLFGTTVTWKANQQSVVAILTTQAEYIALVERVKEAIWLKGMIGEMGICQGCVKIHCDSQSVVHLANHQVYHERTKHIDIRLHFVRDMIKSKEIMVERVASEENPADMFIKSLPRAKFKHCLDLINFIEEACTGRGACPSTAPGAILACLRKPVPNLGAGHAHPLHQAQASQTG
ncbi:aspartyl-tRNA synthetase, partial [Trifolium medium]|nr:aspartyl-tRNA synthetase [Trifolium medium]